MLEVIQAIEFVLAVIGAVTIGALIVGGLTLVGSLAAISRRRRGLVNGKGIRDAP